MDYTSPSTQFSFDVNQSLFFKKDSQNYINVLGVSQLNTLGNVSLLDIYLSTGNIVEPHIHQNASELVYCVSGAAIVSLVNPFSKKLMNFPIQPGQVANVPQGWWHYEVAQVDNTHLIAIFDAPTPEFIGGSDLLRLTPPHIWARSYCLDEAKVKETFAPITNTVFIGPPNNCHTGHMTHRETAADPAYGPQAYYGQSFEPYAQSFEPYDQVSERPYEQSAPMYAEQPPGQPYGWPYEQPYGQPYEQPQGSFAEQPYEQPYRQAPEIWSGWEYTYNRG